MILNQEMMKRLLIILFSIGIVHLTFGQLSNTAYVGSAGGGVSTGGNFTSISVAGDPVGTSDLGSGVDLTTYPGFIPGKMIILSFGLEKDSAVLAVLYQALGGDEWIDNSGWLQTDDIESWAGISLENQRVVGISLPGNNLQNNVPDIILNLNKLDSVNFSDNQLRKLPKMSSMPSLTKLNVAKNRLGFESLINNKGIAEYEYAPQKRIGFTKNDTVRADSAFVLTATISGTGNKYQWVFDDLAEPDDSVAIEGATSNELSIDSLNFENMGSYRLTATNDSLPGLVLESRNQNIWASTDVQGTVFADASGTLLTNGQVEIYRIYDGPFEKSDSAQLDANGYYKIEDVVLGDFILLVKQDQIDFPDVIQTYYVSTDDWLTADTLFLRQAASAIDIEMIFKPEELPPLTNGATFNGNVGEELSEGSDEEGARVEARRKVKRAACSVRRFVPKGRTGQDEEGEFELYAYVESDDDGNFKFTDIEEGRYRLNIQYPGVPMDEDSDIEIIVGGDEESQVFEILATITDDGIVVETRKVLWTAKPFLKNVRLYPNPTDGVMLAEFEVYRKINDLFAIVRDMKGSVLIRKEVDPSLGYHDVKIDLTSYESGMYFLEFSDSSGAFRQQTKISKK